MQHWNFNVTVPLADWILRTTHPGTRQAAAAMRNPADLASVRPD